MGNVLEISGTKSGKMKVALYGVNTIYLQYLHSEEIIILIRVCARKMNVVNDHDPTMPGERVSAAVPGLQDNGEQS